MAKKEWKVPGISMITGFLHSKIKEYAKQDGTWELSPELS